MQKCVKLRDKVKNFFEIWYIFIVVIFIMLVAYKYYGFAPFGEKSLAYMDADIQYLDFFAYFKDVLAGKNNINYTFGKALGGSNIAVFSYYLASPLNLLVVFFEKSELHTFFDALVAIKLALAAVTMRLFIHIRFKINKSNKKTYMMIDVLSIGYALSQYSLAQSSNIMWLDGVYLLPIIALGVYYVVQERNGICLSIAVGMSILFNWYTGGINCLFSIIWFLYESMLYFVSDKRNNIKIHFNNLIMYGYSMIVGVLLSAILFLPTIGAMQKNAKGTLDIASLKDIGFTGYVGSIIQAYSLGAKSAYGKVSLFCGCIVIIGCVAIFFSKNIASKVKTIFGIIIAMTILLFYWKPMFLAFSLFKSAESYWYRYSYVGIFSLIFIASYFYIQCAGIEKTYIMAKTGSILAIVLVIMEYANPAEDMNNIQFTALFLLLIGIGIEFYYKECEKKVTVMISLCLGIILSLEILTELKLEMNSYCVTSVNQFKNYTIEQEDQINQIKSYDKGDYRISQTMSRDTSSYNITAHYNEGLAYNYQSISSYTSCPDDVSRNFLDKVGYRSEAYCMNIVNTSIIGADSFLGVKYILSPYSIDGYVELEKMGEHNGKRVYLNPYALPLAFLFEKSDIGDIEETENPFEYQNELYSQLLGEKVEIYRPLDYSYEKKKNSIEYSIKQLEGNYAYYGNIKGISTRDIRLNINDSYESDYNCWLTPSVFYIPVEKNSSIRITASAENIVTDELSKDQFYAIDLDKFKEVTTKLQDNGIKDLNIKNGKVQMVVETGLETDQNLCISIPYDKGWNIKVNNKIIEPKLIAGSFYSIELPSGHNEICMEYNVEYKKEGHIISLAGGVGVILMVIYWRKKKNDIKNK